MYWWAVYKDETLYSSDSHTWEDLPPKGFIKLMITLPLGGNMQVSGWDFYALEILENGLKVSYWKDVISNDINGDPLHEPHLNKGGNRHFYDDGTADNIKYEDAAIINDGIPSESIKAGIWVDDELAKQLGVL